MILIDTNILAYHLLNEDPIKAERCRQLFLSAARGEIDLFVPATAIAEIAWLLSQSRKVPREECASALRNVLSYRGLSIENQDAVARALQFWQEHGGLSFVDCYHLALANHLGMSELYSNDRKMNRYPGITRLEP